MNKPARKGVEVKCLPVSVKGHKNYIKKNLLNQDNNKNFDKKTAFLLKKLPSYLRAFKTKGKFNRKKRFPAEKALKEFKFIEFNAQTANFLIVDIDHKNLTPQEIFEILKERNILPTYIVYTDRGYQIGWALEHPFVLNPEYQSPLDVKLEKYARYILKKLTYILKGDFAAVRLKGIWRNPLTNRSKIYHSKAYLLNELDIYVKAIDDGIKSSENAAGFHTEGDGIKNKVAKILIDRTRIDEVEIGERNSVLWYLGMFMAKEISKNESLNQNEKRNAVLKIVKKELLVLNSLLRNPLSKKEVLGIHKSVKRYFDEDRLFVSFGKYENWSSEVKRKYMKLYRRKKGVTKFSRTEIKKSNLKKVLYAVSESKNIKEAIEKAKMAKSTFYKYLNALKEKRKLLFLFKLLVCLQKTNPNVIKGFVPLFFDIVNSGFERISAIFGGAVPFTGIKKFDERELIFENSLLNFAKG